MTIEFQCPHCEKLLRTADDKAGVQANCPGCGQLVTVPLLAENASPPPFPAAGLPPMVAASAPEQSCPMCGALNPVTETRCRICGEGLAGSASGTTIRPTLLNIGNVLNVTWALYKSKLGLCIGCVAVMGGIAWIISFVSQMIVTGIQLAVAGGGGGGGGGGDAVQILIVVVAIGMQIVQQVASIYLTLGQVNLMLKVARGEPAQIGDMFNVGRYFWRSLGATLLFVLMTAVGYVLLIIPGIIVSLMFFPYNYYLIDQDTGVIDSLQGARRVTEGNRLTIFLLSLIGFGIMLVGLLACCVGALFSASYLILMQAVAYQMATGRPVARA